MNNNINPIPQELSWIFSYIENIVETPQDELITRFLYETMRAYIVSSFNESPTQNKIRGIIKDVFSGISVEAERKSELKNILRIEAVSCDDAFNDCQMTQKSLLTALCGFGILNSNGRNFNTHEGEGSNQFLENLEKNREFLLQNENQFVTYGLNFEYTRLEKNSYTGHCFSIVQYPAVAENEEPGVRYKLFQSWLTPEKMYDMKDHITFEKTKHHAYCYNGSFSHQECVALIHDLSKFSEAQVWDAEINKLHEKLFRVSLPKLLGQKFKKPMTLNFCYKIQEQKVVSSHLKEFEAVTQLMKGILHLKLLTADEYLEYLERKNIKYEPLIVDLFYE